MVETSESSRLAPLDSLRGIAALCVAIFSHYENFGGVRAEYPYMGFVPARWFYGHSWLLVDMFFVLSGIVLTYRYYEPLGEHRVSANDFFFLRMSRLYPLHVATLLVCAAVQWSLLASGKPTVIYPTGHDLYHFFLHLTYLHAGWFDLQWSYNMPTWSVCSEVFVYVVFFVLASKCSKHYRVACVVAILVGILGQTVRLPFAFPVINDFMGRALVGFFLGSLILFAIRYFDRIGHGQTLGLACLLGLAGITAMAIRVGYDEWVGGLPLPNTLVVFPLVIIACLKIKPLARLLSVRPLIFLGDISYSVYLVHIPMQMLALVVFDEYGVTVPTSRPWVMIAYTASLILVSTLSHYGLERPAQQWLRSLMRRESAAPAVA